MNKTKRTCLSLLLSFAVGFTMLFGSAGFAQAASYDKTKAIFEACGDYIYTTVKEPTRRHAGRLNGSLYGLSHAGYDMSDSYRDTYLANVEKELKEKDGIPACQSVHAVFPRDHRRDLCGMVMQRISQGITSLSRLQVLLM